MATVRRFEELEAWKLAKSLCLTLGVIIESGAFKRCYRLIDQIEGSSGSVMDNIAEGFERGTRGEFIQFLGYSKGSCGELRSQLYRSLNKKYISTEQFDDLCSMVMRVSAMLQKFINYLQQTKIAGIRKRQPANL